MGSDTIKLVAHAAGVEDAERFIDSISTFTWLDGNKHSAYTSDLISEAEIAHFSGEGLAVLEKIKNLPPGAAREAFARQAGIAGNVRDRNNSNRLYLSAGCRGISGHMVFIAAETDKTCYAAIATSAPILSPLQSRDELLGF